MPLGISWLLYCVSLYLLLYRIHQREGSSSIHPSHHRSQHLQRKVWGKYLFELLPSAAHDFVPSMKSNGTLNEGVNKCFFFSFISSNPIGLLVWWNVEKWQKLFMSCTRSVSDVMDFRFSSGVPDKTWFGWSRQWCDINHTVHTVWCYMNRMMFTRYIPYVI